MKGRFFMRTIFVVILLTVLGLPCLPSPAASPGRPNIVFILADDLGFGDVGCYNPTSKIPTPHLDKLAAEGMQFMDAHSPATVCSPTRLSLMTGRHSFRFKGGGRVFVGITGPSQIPAGRLTLPAMLKNKGYTTAAVGK